MPTLLSDDELGLEHPRKRARLSRSKSDIRHFFKKSQPAETGPRPALQESSASFHNKLRGPIAWIPLPRPSKHLVAQYSRLHSEQDQNVAPVAGTDEEFAGEDGLSPSNLKLPATRKPRARARLRVAESDGSESDFEASTEDSDSDSDDASDDASVQSEEKYDTGSNWKSTKIRPSSKSMKIRPSSKPAPKKMRSLLSRESGGPKGLHPSLKPLNNVKDIFEDITSRALSFGLDKVIKHLDGRPIRVATMCSGTESPLLALEMIKECLQTTAKTLEVNHLFSAEIVPFKQAYIERNFSPPIIFRDITELTHAVRAAVPMATTAYGGKVAIPQDVDILIAGTSCVDFSALNSKKKGLDDAGESGDTWNAVLSFVDVFRPRIVLLENVKNAAWDRMLQDYEKLGYESAGVLVDTKDYYLPQTRQRGYMACFDKRTASASSSWASSMKQFQRYASAPVASFLLPSDQISRGHYLDEQTRDVDWSQCEIRQLQYRYQKRLGNARPITHWSESGTMLVPDDSDSGWFKRQVERVLDTVDGATLRKAVNGMYDTRFKTRIWDLSQNLDRDEDGKPFGIVGCITPSGQFFISNAGRAVSSEELLKLQGLPLGKISFTTETPPEMQDLAGNAMSSTVVGSAILSALIAGYENLTPNATATPTATVNQIEMVPLNLLEGEFSQVCSSDADLPLVAMEELLQKLPSRRCYCEGSVGVTSNSIQQCRDCGHNTCSVCGGNPEHNYRRLSQGLSHPPGLSPSEFEEHLRSIVPLRLIFSSETDEEHSALDIIGDTFCFTTTRRTHCWTVTYKGLYTKSTLELVLSKSGAQWRLLSNTDANAPVAISKADTLLGKDWKIRLPETRKVHLLIEGLGEQVPSWWARCELPDFLKHAVWETLNISITSKSPGDCGELAARINGRYRYLPHCGTACEGLYKKEGDVKQGDTPVYLFLDATHTGGPEDDSFVFCDNVAKLEYNEARMPIARVDAVWRPWPKTSGSSLLRSFKTSLQVDTWRTLKHHLTAPNDGDFHIQRTTSPGALINSAGCSDAATILRCCSVPDETGSVTDNSWLFEAVRRNLACSEWTPLRNPQLEEHEPCSRCAPLKPLLRWKVDGSNTLVPYEDPATAAVYERAVKSRPDDLQFNGCQLSLNAVAMAHRARARLPKDMDPRDIQYSWRIETRREQSSAAVPFRLKSTCIAPLQEQQKLEMSVDLFPKQLVALAWMKQQETGVEFMLEESEESLLRAIAVGWRAEVCAHARVTVKGGIAADHPGFGKTITSLALIQSEPDLKPRQHPGLIATAATLIICPASLSKQWQSEIRDKLRWTENILMVNSTAELAKHTITDFKNARIIIVNRSIFGTELYAERIAAFAAVPGPATKSGRAYSQWLDFARGRFPEHLEILENRPGDLRNHIRSTYQETLNSDEFRAVVPSRRLRGKDYVAGKDKKKSSVQKATAQKAAAGSLDTTHVSKPLFEMFFFNRLIIDEFHQYENREYAAIAALKADKRWGLSATPAIGDVYDIAQIAGLLGIPLRIGSDAKGIMKMKNIHHLRKDMTDFEKFDRMRQKPSLSLQKRIHDKAQEFLDTFVRQNILDYATELEFQDHLVPVTLDLDHRALYAELSQHLNSLDMRIKKGKPSTATERQERMNAAIQSSASAEEALTKAAAFCDRKSLLGESSRSSAESPSLALKSLREQCDQKAKKILDQLPKMISDAWRDEHETFKPWFESRISNGELGDAETTAQIQSISSSRNSSSMSKGPGKTAKASDAKRTGSRAKTAEVGQSCKRLLVEKRSSRYLENVALFQQEQSALCSRTNCTGQSSEAAVSTLCGHTVCSDCYKHLKSQASTSCPAEGCSAAMHGYHLLWRSKMGNLKNPTATMYGAKLQAVVEILNTIQQSGEQAILFVQFENQLQEAERALKDARISAIVVKSTKLAGDQFSAFRDSAGTKDTVIVLNASDETAAGSNLQNANHVIFLSPLLRDTQYEYESTMAQAIGRVRRYGQKRRIHIYRVVALDAIDVDILEHRERRTDALVQQGGPEITPPPDYLVIEGGETKKRERTQLVRDDGVFSLRPQSWLVRCGPEDEEEDGKAARTMGKNRMPGWEDFSSLVKFSKAFTENDG